MTLVRNGVAPSFDRIGPENTSTGFSASTCALRDRRMRSMKPARTWPGSVAAAPSRRQTLLLRASSASPGSGSQETIRGGGRRAHESLGDYYLLSCTIFKRIFALRYIFREKCLVFTAYNTTCRWYRRRAAVSPVSLACAVSTISYDPPVDSSATGVTDGNEAQEFRCGRRQA